MYPMATQVILEYYTSTILLYKSSNIVLKTIDFSVLCIMHYACIIAAKLHFTLDGGVVEYVRVSSLNLL